MVLKKKAKAAAKKGADAEGEGEDAAGEEGEQKTPNGRAKAALKGRNSTEPAAADAAKQELLKKLMAAAE